MRKYITLAVLAQAVFFTSLSAQEVTNWKQFLQREDANFFEICSDVERFFEKNKNTPPGAESENPDDEGAASNQYGRWKWFWESRVNPDGSFPDIRSIAGLRSSSANTGGAQSRGTNQDCGWELISQSVCSGGYSGMGRTTSIAFHPTNPDIYYVGGQSGGVWKTTDGGISYTPVSDGLPYNSVSNILVDYKTPDILYLSNGDYAGGIYNSGIYKSYDAGLSWEPTGLSWLLSQNVSVSNAVMNPEDPDILLVAASNGLWRTADGGDTWAQVRSGNHTDVEFRPGDGATVYAAFYGSANTSDIYKSSDGGLSWNKTSSFGILGNRIQMTVSPADPQALAVVCVASNGDQKFFYSANSGGAFDNRADCPESDVLIMSPTNPNLIYCGGVNVHRSTNQGASWQKVSHWHGGTADPVVHADQRNVAWQPGSNRIFFCNDGGIWRYDEPAEDWVELSNGLIITQFYHIAVSQTEEMFMIGGTQDNGGRKRVAAGEWEATNGGDAMEVAIDYTNADIMYTTYIYGRLYRSLDRWTNDTGYRISDNLPGQTPEHDLEGSWVAPYRLDPQNPNAIVLGYADVYRSTNRGDSWTKISTNLTGNPNSKLDALAIAPSDPNTIYTSNNNTLYKTTNLGMNWSSHATVTSAKISCIAVHPENPELLFITKGTFSNGNKVFRSENGGSSWTNISGSLPNVPTNTIFIDVATDGSYTLFAGNDIGVWYRKRWMSDWVSMNQNLPITVISDLELQRASRKLRAGTYGRGIWEYDLGHLPAKNFAICTDVNRAAICTPASYTATISANAWQDLGGAVSLSFSGLPPGATASLSALELPDGGTATITFDLPAGLAEGEFPVTIYAIANGDTAMATIRLTLTSNDFSGMNLHFPANGSSGVSRWPLLRWNGVPDADLYDLELGASPAFEPASVFKAYSNLSADSLKWTLALEEGKLYYWRVRPANECGSGPWTPAFVFSTTAKTCQALESQDLPINITPNQVVTVESKITVLNSGPISEIKIKNFEGNHAFFKDLEAYLVAPSGSQVLLFKEKCGGYNGIFKLGFEDEAPNPFGCPPPKDGNSYRPEGLLSDLKGQESAGNWILRVKDNTISSGGQIKGFAIEFCSDLQLNPPVIVHNQTLQLAPGNNAVITTNLLLAEDANTAAAQLVFTLMTVPEKGELQRAWTGAMKIGDKFTQADIDQGDIRYFDYGTGSASDQFNFNVSDGEGGLAADVFHIQPFPLGANEPTAAFDFFLAPNPATETVRLTTSEVLSDKVLVRLHNLAGQALKSWNWDSGEASIQLDLSGLAVGMYLVSVQSGQAVGVRKIAIR
ncbi:MAG: T9SS type A sorting domain-containing protein [Lewinellaceae bacterium]|nr:T9SS type A sorting domain-containing protein [Lewinellaceae bacterium]